MKMELMSKNLVRTMKELIKNDGIVKLIANDVAEPFKITVANPEGLLMKRIHPVPFDTDAVTLDGVFLRIYYNRGNLSSEEVITESQILIDIICSRNLWLIHDVNGEEAIRPYEIMGRVIDMLGRNSVNPYIRLEFDGYQHLYINTKFDCVRLYANYYEIET